MGNRFLELVREYRRRPASKSDQTVWEFIAEKDPHIFSHHPPVEAFRDHVWEFRGLYLCKGCVMTFAGMAAGAVFQVLTGWLGRFGITEAAFIFVLLLAPTLVAHAFNLPRPIKHVSRFLLGVLIVSAIFMLFITDSWAVRFIIVCTYFAVKIPMERLRVRRNRSP